MLAVMSVSSRVAGSCSPLSLADFYQVNAYVTSDSHDMSCLATWTMTHLLRQYMWTDIHVECESFVICALNFQNQ
jgi:hypothetical protein